jgi:hypothetical protein
LTVTVSRAEEDSKENESERKSCALNRESFGQLRTV